jgi:aminoglycoside phosphotransferase (APT) family kinase protein
VAFGFGTHFCLGAHLARLEIRVMFEELLARMPDWELVDPEGPAIMPRDLRPRLLPRPHPHHPDGPPMSDTERRLTAWFADQLPDAGDVTIEGFDHITVGHSAETILLTLVRDGARQDVVVRMRPPSPGLLEPYDLARQFTILRALESTPVQSPRALWLEPTGDVLGRDFYVMERLGGEVYERGVPAEVQADPARVRRMSEGIVEQLAAIHTVDLQATGLDTIADGRAHLDHELAHWIGEIDRVKQARLPALERLAAAVREQQPEPCPTVTLVHGDPKPGNIAFDGEEVSAVFDWELATIGDPLTDVGYLEANWALPGYITSVPGALTADEAVARWEELTGIPAEHRAWYRAFQWLKLSVILLVAGHLYDAGHSDDPRFIELAHGVPFLTSFGLRDLGIDEDLEPGPYLPRQERISAVKEAARR